jgi:hypothetical protein
MKFKIDTLTTKYFYNGDIEIGKENISLHNILDKKTYFIFTAIEKLEPRFRMNDIAKKKFYETKTKALNSSSAEEALEIIGYLFKRTPLIYKDAFKEGDRK